MDTQTLAPRTFNTALSEDPCRLRLEERNQGNSAPSMADDTRETSQKTTLGLVMGVRFALGSRHHIGAQPNGTDNSKFAVWQPGLAGNDQAMAIADYRSCRSALALQAYNER